MISHEFQNDLFLQYVYSHIQPCYKNTCIFYIKQMLSESLNIKLGICVNEIVSMNYGKRRLTPGESGAL